MFTTVINTYDGWMIHLGHYARFPPKSCNAFGTDMLRHDHFHGNFPVQNRIVRHVNNAHSTAAKLPRNFVAVEKFGSNHESSIIACRGALWVVRCALWVVR